MDKAADGIRVSKVASLVPEGWQLMLMFHGEEDLETFRREVPASVYYLPWLGPIGAANTDRNCGLADTRWKTVRARHSAWPIRARPLPSQIKNNAVEYLG
jgi:hypothetical protein